MQASSQQLLVTVFSIGNFIGRIACVRPSLVSSGKRILLKLAKLSCAHCDVVINQGYLSDRCSSVLPRPAFLGVSLALMGGAQLLLALSVPAGALS